MQTLVAMFMGSKNMCFGISSLLEMYLQSSQMMDIIKKWSLYTYSQVYWDGLGQNTPDPNSTKILQIFVFPSVLILFPCDAFY